MVQLDFVINVSYDCLQVSVIKAKIHESLGMPAGKQKLQLDVSKITWTLVFTWSVHLKFTP